MLSDIPLSLIDDNPFNCRKTYEKQEDLKLANSLKIMGLMSPVKVRHSGSRYQLVYGHRRVRAARSLNWGEIRAEVEDLSDELMLKFSLIENMERKNLSDFETAMSFWRMNREFGMTLEEIGELTGFSAAHVCNFVRMTEMFDDHENLMNDSTMFADLQQITEHHARILLRVDNSETRRRLLRLVVAEELSVRDLQRIVQKFRAWFRSERGKDEGSFFQDQIEKHSDATEVIVKSLMAEEELPHKGDYEAFQNLHAFEKGFSVYSNLPPSERFEGAQALEHEKDWFFSVGPKVNRTFRDVRIQFFPTVALATLSVDQAKESDRKMGSERGTVLFLNVDGTWKIVHEHWSNFQKTDKEGVIGGK
jgi:ParB family chromosome partitioning protein